MNYEFSPWVFSGALFISFWVMVSILGLFIVRKTINREIFKQSHDVAGFTYNILGVLYAVILGFTIITVQGNYNDAYMNSELEVGHLADLYRDASVFPENIREEIRKTIKDYVSLVVDEEWALMSEGKTSVKAIFLVQDLWRSYSTIEAEDARIRAWLQESLSKLNGFNNMRLQRLLTSKESMSSISWAILVAGAVINISFLYFFYIENFKMHVYYVAVLSGYISFILFLIMALDSAYTGGVALEPKPFKKVKEYFDKWE